MPFFKTCLFLALLTVAVQAAAAATPADRINGVWRTASGGYVQIYADGESYDGKIVGSRDGQSRQDTNNPDPAQQDRSLLGQVVLRDLVYQQDGEYEKGRVYDPDSGKDYNASATLTGPDTLDVRGFVGFSLLGKSQTWHRIDPTTDNVHTELLERPVGPGPSS